MKLVNINIKLYSYGELKEESREKAYDEHYNFLNECSEFGAKDEDFVYNQVEKSILMNEYYFFEDGSLANVTIYTGRHPKAGTKEFSLYGETVVLV